MPTSSSPLASLFKRYSNQQLVTEIFTTGEEMHGEVIFELCLEAERRSLVVTFSQGDVNITQEEYGL